MPHTLPALGNATPAFPPASDKLPSDAYQALLQSAADAIVSITPAGIIREFNPAAERLFGRPASWFLGRNVSCLMPEPDRSRHDGYLERYQQTGERRIIGRNREVEALRADGSLFPAELAVTEVQFADEHFFTCIVRDMTERKAARQKLLDANQWLDATRTQLSQKADELRTLCEQAAVLRQAADAANQAKSEFLTNTSHELRTPLTAIMGFAEIVIEESTQPEVRDFAHVILENGRHLLQIVNDILDFAAIEAGRADLQREAVSPTAIVMDLVRSLGPQAAQHNVTLSHFVSPEVPATLLTDLRRFRQILLNLVANAIKFSPAGSVVIRLHLDQLSNPPMLLTEVADTGIGIPSEKLPHLFQAFSQIDPSLTRSRGGTGLGLAISDRLSRLLGGDLRVTSTPGCGSTFSLRLPLETPDAAQTVPATTRPSGSDAAMLLVGRRVLIVDDSPDNVRLLNRFLQKAGALTQIAVDGQQAVDRVAESLASGTALDAILLDLQMPVMDGYEAAATIRKLGYDGPMIAVTAEAQAAAVRRSLEAGCDDLLTKPVDRRALLALLRRHVLAARQRTPVGNDELMWE